MLVSKYRNLPQAYDLGHIIPYLMILHKCPMPLIEIEKRKLNSSLVAGLVEHETVDLILEWKRKWNLQSADESEYRYLLRDLNLIADRVFDPDLDLVIPLGGDGPSIGSFLSSDSKAKMFHLTDTGEMLHDQLISDRPVYENSLFWLILRNQSYLPLIQQVILNPKSYNTDGMGDLIETNDSVSKNCALQWLRYFGIERRNRLETEVLARRLLSAAILEINSFFERGGTYYVKEIDRRLNEVFSLSPSATDFVSALDIIFQYSAKAVIRGYTSGRRDISLRNHPNISMVMFLDKIPVTTGFTANSAEVLKITKYVGER
jgi:hypothetical protein